MGIWDLWNRKSSKDFAKDRLKLLLVSDRAGCSSEEELDIQITKTESEDHRGMIPVMVANIPIRDIKHKGN